MEYHVEDDISSRSASYDVCHTNAQTEMKMESISQSFLPRMLMPLDSKLIISYIKSHYCDNINLGYGDYIRERYRRLTNNNNNVTSSRLVNICQIVNGLPFEGKSQLTENKNNLAIHFAGFFQNGGGDKIELNKGMSSLLDPLKAKLNSNSLRLNTRVNKIEWNNSRRKTGRNTKVTCSDGRILYGDHVIVAVPLGFLKENAHTLFQPPISDVKLDAINRVGFGTISKVYLCYKDSFWSRQFTFVWPGQGTGHTAVKLWSQTLKFTTMENHNNVLEVEILGTEFEILPDSQIEEQLTAILCLHFKLDLPKPVRVIKSDWFSNPLFRGTHPYLSIQCSEQDPALLEEPMRRGEVPIVQFAGDYTHKSYVCLIHSARASGIREAHRINNIYDKFYGSENTNF